jgi:hypothetical protein
MRWQACKTCGAAQLANPMPPDLVYQGGHATALGAAWDRHHTAFAEFVNAHHEANVLEVGGGGGKLASLFRKLDRDTTWTILEPNPVIVDSLPPGIDFVDGFFDAGVDVPEGVKTLVFCHSLEHLYDVADAVELMATKLVPGGTVLVAWPDLESWIVAGSPGAINWEHTFYCPLDVLRALFARHGFAHEAEARFGDKHSVFLAFRNTGSRHLGAFPAGDAAETQDRLGRYFGSFQRKVKKINDAVARRDCPAYVSPASIYTQYLFAFGLEQGKISGLIDNSKVKQGRRLYGTHLEIFPTAVMEQGRAKIFLNGGAHDREMAAGFKAVNPAAEVTLVADL